MQAVLARNGQSSQAKFDYSSAKVLADEIRAAGVPVIASVITDPGSTVTYEHAVLIQWDEKGKQFLVNNIDTTGPASQHTQREFESGELRVPGEKTGTHTDAYVDIDFRNAVIFARRP